MTNHDKERFNNILLGFLHCLNRQSTAQLTAMAFLALSDCAIDNIETATIILLRSAGGYKGDYIGGVRDILFGNAKNRAECAWIMLKKCAKHSSPDYSHVFPDELMHRVVQDLDGLQSVFAFKNDYEMHQYGGEFKGLYEAYAHADRPVDFPARLVGRAECYANRHPELVETHARYQRILTCLHGDALACEWVVQNGFAPSKMPGRHIVYIRDKGDNNAINGDVHVTSTPGQGRATERTGAKSAKNA